MAIQNTDRNELKKLILDFLQENLPLLKKAIIKSRQGRKSNSEDNCTSDNIIDSIFNEYGEVLKALS